MDQISRQLKEEIASLQQYIEHTEKRLLTTNWVEQLLDPFMRLEHEFAEEEIREVVEALHQARHEAVYDIIVGRLARSSPIQSKTLDWTATGPSKSDFVCVFFSEQGLRLRHMNRTQHNKALGLCPNW